MISRAVAVLLCLFTCFPPAIAAGYGGSERPKESTTNRLVRFLERNIELCRSLETVYRYDCYRQKYSSAAGKLAGKPAYAVPLGALLDVQRTLDRIVANNADPTAKKIRVKRDTFRAITPEATAEAKESFRNALDEAATELLRSYEGAGDHYARIAQVLNSNKVLLRAMLRLFDRSLPGHMLG